MVTLVVYVDNIVLAVAEVESASEAIIKNGIRFLLEERGLTFEEDPEDGLVLSSGHRITWVESGPSTPDFVRQALEFDREVKQRATISRIHEC